jgi:outer membrane protein assembly factor BamB
MFVVGRSLGVVVLLLILQSCSYVDDYLLGKDNTPQPSALPEIKQKVRLQERWSQGLAASGKASTYLKLKPSIQGQNVYIANANGVVQAFDQAKGRLKWTRTIKQGVVSGPTVKEGYVAIGTARSSVIVLRQEDGADLLELKVSGDALSKPVIVDNKIIIKTIDGNLYAFSLKNGKKLWMSEHGAPSLILKASSSPVILGGFAVVGFSDGKLDAIDINTGRLVWQRSIAYASGSSDVERLVDIDADPIVRDKVAYLASYQGYVGALSLANGEFNWRKPLSVYKNMAMDGSTLYVTDSSDVLWAFDRQSGLVKWKQLALKARGLTEPLLTATTVVVGDRTGYLHLLDKQTGELIARTKLNGPIDISPAVVHNKIFVMTANGKLYRFSVR